MVQSSANELHLTLVTAVASSAPHSQPRQSFPTETGSPALKNKCSFICFHAHLTAPQARLPVEGPSGRVTPTLPCCGHHTRGPAVLPASRAQQAHQVTSGGGDWPWENCHPLRPTALRSRLENTARATVRQSQDFPETPSPRSSGRVGRLFFKLQVF